MIYNIIPTEKFKKEAKRLIKKYPSLKIELMGLNNQLSLNPEMGTPLGNNSYKIRLAIKSKGKGKSGGARIITYLVNEHLEIYLLTIYDKAEFYSIDDKTLRRIISNIDNETNG
jgi:mRNA-degrading endonuclease RelE of RelBE toxin-antitoxin system